MGTQDEKKKTGNEQRQIAVFVTMILVAGFLLYSRGYKLFSKPTTTTTNAPTSAQIQYEKVDLQDMLDELDANALRAEEKYQDKYIEITGEIRSFDSDGKYISIAPCGAPKLSLDTVLCDLTDQVHKAFLLEKNKGDVVTIRGKVTSIGEVIGYHIDIAEISD